MSVLNGGGGRLRALRFLLSIPIAFSIVWTLQVVGVAGSCGSDGNISACNGGGGGGGGGPTATAVATATNTPVASATPDPRITAIEQLPLQGRAPDPHVQQFYT
ncbi:MAG: hypothetical protein ACREMU_11730, partial [Gemmatimonadaceae bacterium]